MTSSDGIIRAVGREFSPSRHRDLHSRVSLMPMCDRAERRE